ncbi:response regulator transcription factor [Burkholderia cepacia]|uniref:response regulator transcription factor n=1 Tax=Burkholderia cepacia TaxID=292 RepID=UPI00069D5DA4|nr:helix-turn-helix transcriptional regulator [Burkholderia cepacia]
MKASRRESIDSINFLGDVFLRVHALSCELPAPSFIGSAVSLVSQSISCRSAWWGLVGRGANEVTPTVYKKELIGLPADFEERWLPISAQDAFAKEVESRIGEVHAFSTDQNYGAPGKTEAVRAFCREYDLAHGVSILLGEPFTRNHFFCTLYRGQGARPFDEIEMAYFGQFMKYTLQIWRKNLQRMLSVPAADNVHSSGIADKDGRIVGIGGGLCEFISANWPTWRGGTLPQELAQLFSDAPCRMRLGGRTVEIGYFGSYLHVSLAPDGHGFVLSPKERSIARLFAAGRSYKEISRVIGLSPATVRTYLQRIYAHLGVSNKVQLGRVLAPDSADGQGEAAQPF